ncbi:MAG: MerR family DNA-binding transcriptional regulator [Cyanobacteria bacterium P01_D01_bin.50]
MYSIGEYSRIAQVSKRLLRYYDEIGLFQPIRIDIEIQFPVCKREINLDLSSIN